ncbi:Zn-dependent exopeptidase, partial [Nadsonia fulvescens var. elongata DSM 6958]
MFLKRIIYLLMVSVGIGIALWFGILPSDTIDHVVGNLDYSEEALMRLVRDELAVSDMQERFRYLSSMPHLAGTSGDLSLAKFVQDEFHSFGYYPIELNERKVYLTFPGYNGDIELKVNDGDKSYSANFHEQNVPSSGQSSQEQALPVHGLSWPGEAEGHGIYVNYGTKQDFKKLIDAGVQIEGSIMFMKYGKLQPGLKITLAEQHGAKGVVLFSDSSNDKSWPEGPDYAKDAVQRAHVGITALSPGDLLTPGWPTSPNTQRARIDDVHTIAHIPSIPISWKEVKPFLESIKGYGLRVDNEGWSSIEPKMDEWWSGSHDTNKKIKLRNNPVVESEHPIWNILTKIDGSDQEEKAIIIGAPRDAWCFGAVDSASGTGVLLELARIISKLGKVHGWTPRRSIYFASWDGSKQNLIGSTEWVEYHIQELRKSGAAYINLADAVSGTDLRMDGHPILSRVLANALESVRDPVTNDTLATKWGDRRIGQLNLDGDHLLFMSSGGIPSLDIGFKGEFAVPRDSCYDSNQWNEIFGDPGLQYQSTLVELVASIIIQLSDHHVVPFDTDAYANYIGDHINDLKAYAKAQPDWKEDLLEFSSLDNSANILRESSQVFKLWYDEWAALTSNGISESPILSIRRWSWNSRLINLDKHLLHEKGAPGREWLKHVIYGPQLWYPTEGDFQWMTFPGVRDYIEAGNWELAQRQIDLTSQVMHASFDKFI